MPPSPSSTSDGLKPASSAAPAPETIAEIAELAEHPGSRRSLGVAACEQWWRAAEGACVWRARGEQGRCSGARAAQRARKGSRPPRRQQTLATCTNLARQFAAMGGAAEPRRCGLAEPSIRSEAASLSANGGRLRLALKSVTTKLQTNPDPWRC